MISDHFTVGTNYNNIYRTLGDFWNVLFKDQKLINGVITAQTFSVDEISDNEADVNTALNEPACPNYLLKSTYRLAIPSTNITQQLCSVGNESKLYTTVFLVGQTTPDVAYIIKLPRKIKECYALSTTVNFDDCVLLRDVDFKQLDSETLVIYKNIKTYGFTSVITSVNGTLSEEYIVYIWGSYGSFGYDARFGRSPVVSVKNDIVYDLLTNENTYAKIIQTFQKAVGITVASVTGEVTRSWYEGDYLILYNGSLIKIPSKFTPIIKIGDLVTPSSILIKELSFFEDISNSKVRYYYVSPNKIPNTKYGISIPNSPTPITYNGVTYISTESGDLVISTENESPVVTEGSNSDLDLGIKGTVDDVNTFYNTLLEGLTKYDVTLPEVITSSNPVSIIFKDIHAVNIPVIDIEAPVLYDITNLEAIIDSLHGMSLPSTDMLINSTVRIKDHASISFEDTVNCFIVYEENTAEKLSCNDTKYIQEIHL